MFNKARLNTNNTKQFWDFI